MGFQVMLVNGCLVRGAHQQRARDPTSVWVTSYASTLKGGLLAHFVPLWTQFNNYSWQCSFQLVAYDVSYL